MRSKSIIISIIFIGLSFHSLAQNNFSVMTWNIWHGGLHGNADTQFEKDSSNTINVLKVINQNKPDILLMQETYCCGMNIAKDAGYKYSWRGSSNLSIHSKYPIIDTLNIFRSFNSHGVILDINGKKLMLINIWLHYLPDYFNDIKTMTPDSLIIGEGTTRLKEIKSILKEIDSLSIIYKDMPIIIGGDFNSGSHLDWIESTKLWHYGKVVEWPVSKLVCKSGFTDSFREINTNPVNSLQGSWGFLSKEIISDRIDYIYYKGNGINAKSSRIVMDDPPDGFFNSDHRAIQTVFDIGN